MKLSLEAIELIDVIAKKGSFAKASEVLYKAPSTISYTVLKIEEQLGLPLFYRNGPHISLTSFGSTILEEGKLLLIQLDNLENRLDKMSRGVEDSITITLDAIYPLEKMAPLILDFYHSKASTRLKINREVMMGTWDSLLNFKSDLIISVGEEPDEESGYRYSPIGHLPFVFCVAPNHPFAHYTDKISKYDLQRFPAIVLSDSSQKIKTRTKGITRGQKRILVSTLDDKIMLQKAGIGHGFLPKYIAEPFIKKGELIEKEIAAPLRREPLFIAWRQNEDGIALNWWKEKLSSINIIS